jgi:tetratricopeptide (TPR) repeat protein
MFETALQKDPNSGEAMAGLVNTYDVQKKPSTKIIASCNAQISKAPQNALLWTLLGREQSSADKIAAKASFEHALSINGADATALTMLAQLQSSTGDLDGAAANYQKLVDTNPRSATPLIMLGTLEQSRGNLDRSQQLYQKALDVEPNQPVAANNHAYLIMESGGNLDVALNLAQTAVRGMPNNPSAADTLGWAFYLKGVYGSARDVLEGAVKAAPENANIQFHLGMTYDKIEDHPKATAHLKRALQLAPTGPNAASIRQMLSSLGVRLD